MRYALSPSRLPPLCKGRWYGEAVPEGLLPGFLENDNPSVNASR